MVSVLVLDTGPAGMIAHPRPNEEFSLWLQNALAAGSIVVLPEIVDYELRRNFKLEIGRGKTSFQQSLKRLDELREVLTFLPIDSQIMLSAAEFWAAARLQHKPTGDPKELDGDAILAAQALQVEGIVVTTNVGHLELFVEAKTWQEIKQEIQ